MAQMAQMHPSRPTPYYPDYEWMRSSDRRMSVALAQSPTHSEQYDTLSELSRRTSPSSEIDNKPGPAARKRVPVACERCRKRKIKCSGNDNGSRGCSNCINAGNHGCQFLRVASMSMALGIAQHSPRSYQPNRYSPYALPSRSFPPTHQTYHNSVPYNNAHHAIEYQSYPSSAQNNPWPGASYRASYPIQYEEEPAPPYSAQPPSYMLPAHAEMIPNLQPFYVQSHRNNQNGMQWAEQSTTVASPNSNLMPAISSVRANETPSSFQPLGTSAVSMHPTDRTLPTPVALTRAPVAGSISSTESLLASGLGHKSSDSWHTESTSNASQVSNRTSYSTSQESNHTPQGVCIAPFGYNIGVGAETQEPIQSATASAAPETLQSSNETRIQGGVAALNGELNRRLSRESLESSPNSVSYPHTSASFHRSAARRPLSGHLVNGQEYVSFSHARNASLISDAREDCAGYQTGVVNRTSVASLNNAASY